MFTPRLKHAVTIAAALALGTSACSPSATPATSTSLLAPTSSSAPPTQTPLSPGISDPRLPDDTTLLSAALSLLSIGSPDDTVRLLSTNIPDDDVVSCMADAGFQYTAGETPQEQIAGNPLYSLSKADYAARYGFGLASTRLGMMNVNESSDPNAAYVGSLSSTQRAAYSQALGSCRGMRDPDRVAFSNALNSAVEEFRKILAADDGVVAATAAWKACMQSAGYSFDSPEEMRGQFARVANSTPPNGLQAALAAEIAAAVANVPCELPLIDEMQTAVTQRFAEFKQTVLAGLPG